MNCKGCGKPIDWMNWNGKCFGCHMHGDDRLKPKPKPAPVEKVTKPVQVQGDLFASAGNDYS